MGNFFSHENTSVPPSLSKDVKARSRDKADLVDSLYDVCNTLDKQPTVDDIVVEDLALINMYQPTGQRTFKEQFEEKMKPFLQEKVTHANLLDVVWNIYLENSLKTTTRQKRGDGSR